MKTLSLVILMLVAQPPAPTKEIVGIRVGDNGYLSPHHQTAKRSDECGRFIWKNPTRGPFKVITLRINMPEEEGDRGQTITLDTELVRVKEDLSVAGSPQVKVVQMSDMRSTWVEVRMNPDQIKEAKCLTK